ncbi:unnamed protein product [Cutaneotrichosporon oleaginosum]
MPARYPNDAAKITAATNLLTGKAINFIRPYAEKTELPLFLTSWDMFQVKFKSQFFNPDQVASKTAALNALKQTSSAQDYANVFDNLVAYLDLSEQSKRQHFFFGLRPRVQERILDPLDIESFPTYTSLVDKAIRLDNLLYSHFMAHSSASPSAAPTPATSATSGRTSRTFQARPFQQRGFQSRSPWPNSQFNRSTPSSASVPTSTTKHEPMDVDAIKIPRTAAERAKQREFRLANGLCTCCGTKGHFIKDCPNATRYCAHFSNVNTTSSMQASTSSTPATSMSGNFKSQ